MIISHEHRYVFVELAHTGSTAVSRELRKNYAGEKILGKHSTYDRFLRLATDEEKSYFAFGGVRNPLDVAVTKYVKYATDHGGRYSDAVKVARNRGAGNWLDRQIQRRVIEQESDFSSFFAMVYRFPFNTWACLNHKELDFVMRFERLQHDFSRVLTMIGLEQVRPLPVVNSSSRERSDFTAYYSPDAIERAKKVFAGYMNEWEYEFPEEWGAARYTSLDRFKYQLATSAMKLYWRYIKQQLFRKNWNALYGSEPSASEGLS